MLSSMFLMLRVEKVTYSELVSEMIFSYFMYSVSTSLSEHSFRGESLVPVPGTAPSGQGTHTWLNHFTWPTPLGITLTSC